MFDFDRDDHERDAPTGYLDSTAPRVTPGAEALPHEAWLRDEDRRSAYAVNPRHVAAAGDVVQEPAGPADVDRWRSRCHELALDVAGELEIEGHGRAAWLSWATDANVAVRIQLQSKSNARQTALVGWSVSGLPFERLFITWDAQPGKKVELTIVDAPAEWFAGGVAPGGR